MAEDDHLREICGALGHDVVTIPRVDVTARTDDCVPRRLALADA